MRIRNTIELRWGAYRQARATAVKRNAVRGPGAVYAFVPAHGGSKAGSVQERLGRTWSEDFGLAVLLVGFEPGSEAGPSIRSDGAVDRCTLGDVDYSTVRNLLAFVKARYQVICVDLTEAPERAAASILKLAHSVFLVSDAMRASIETARETADRLRPVVKDRLTLLLLQCEGGLRLDLAEDAVGVPLCGLVETSEQLARLAKWMALPQPELIPDVETQTQPLAKIG